MMCVRVRICDSAGYRGAITQLRKQTFMNLTEQYSFSNMQEIVRGSIVTTFSVAQALEFE